MRYINTIGAIALAAFCVVNAHAQNAPISEASKYDPARYPDWSGQLRRVGTGGNRYDQTKAPGRAQQAPLTPEYQAIFDAGLKDQAAGGQGGNQTYSCTPGGMPREMAGNQGLEFVVTPKVTHVIFVQAMPRRIYTDGRDWPTDLEPSFDGYSIGKWIDEDGDGRYDVLEVETRNFRGPRSFDNAGIPLHEDNQTIVKERIYRDKKDPELIYDEMTTIDNALTRPWTVTKTFRFDKEPHFVQNICSVGNNHVQIGKDSYFLSADGFLMPTKKGQAPPDSRYFTQTRN